MRGLTVENVSQTGFKIGLGIGLVPVASTTLIACSKIIFINAIANVAIYILTAGTYYISVPATFVAVPLLWKISLIAAGAGAVICAVSLIAYFVDHFYQMHLKKKAAAAAPKTNFHD